MFAKLTAAAALCAVGLMSAPAADAGNYPRGGYGYGYGYGHYGGFNRGYNFGGFNRGYGFNRGFNPGFGYGRGYGVGPGFGYGRGYGFNQFNQFNRFDRGRGFTVGTPRFFLDIRR